MRISSNNYKQIGLGIPQAPLIFPNPQEYILQLPSDISILSTHTHTPLFQKFLFRVREDIYLFDIHMRPMVRIKHGFPQFYEVDATIITTKPWRDFQRDENFEFL